jgi:hypothetical protein
MRILQGLSEKIPLTAKRFPLEISAPQRGSSTFQLASLLEQFHRATCEVNKLVLGREADDLTGRLEPGSWSATECLDHLARTTLSFLPAILTGGCDRSRTHRKPPTPDRDDRFAVDSQSGTSLSSPVQSDPPIGPAGKGFCGRMVVLREFTIPALGNRALCRRACHRQGECPVSAVRARNL